MTIYSVSSSEELMDALASAKGGDTIELSGGDYGQLSLRDGQTNFNVKFDTEVTIRSADADRPASFSGMDLRGVSNLTIDGVVFDYEFAQGDPTWFQPFQVGYGSSDITIRNSIFDGDLASGVSEIDDGYGSGKGLSVRDSVGISIEGNEFFNWHRGATFSQVQDLMVAGNEVYDIRSDGFNFAEVTSVLIEDNYLHDFNGSPDSDDHRDMIQFWTNGTDAPSIDIVIRNNTLDIGEGSYTQSIFMRNEEVDTDRAGAEMFYQNVLIENNTINNGHAHGITVGETNGLIIRNNSVLQTAADMHGLDGLVTVPKINVASDSTSVVIEKNITSAINGYQAQSSWLIQSNALLQPEDYIDAFITSSLETVSGTHNFVALPEGEIESLQAGATSSQFQDAPDGLTPQFQVYSDIASDKALIFDASLTVDAYGLVLESEADFLWTFGDGSTAQGRVVKHEFAEPGSHGATLTVVAKDGAAAQAQFTTGIAGKDIIQFDAQAGQFEALAYGEEMALDGSGLALQATTEGFALKLGDEGTQASVPASELSRFFGTDVFEMSMSLKADSANSWGEVARIHASFTTNVDQDGNFQLDLFPDDGSRVKLVSEGIALNDGGLHNVTVRYDGVVGLAEIVADGQVVASEVVFGSLGGGVRSLDFGNPWGDKNFDGELSAFTLSAASHDYPIYDGETLPISSAETPQLDPSPTAPVTEDPGATADTTNPPETIEPDVTQDTVTDGDVQNEFGETGTLTLNHKPQTVTLQRSYENPVVVAFVATENGGQPVNVRVSDIGGNSLTLQLQEPNYLDGKHLYETVNYMVVEAGTWVLPDGTVFEAGALNSDKLSSQGGTKGFEQISFSAEFDSTPVILSQVQSFNDRDFVTTRQRAADADGFKLTMQEEEALNQGSHASETLGWIAIETGNGTAGDVNWQAGSISSVTELDATAGLSQSITGGANVIAGLSSFAGPNTAWARGKGSTDTSFDVYVEEETSADDEIKHNAETISYFVFDKVGTISGMPIQNGVMPEGENPLTETTEQPVSEEESGLTEPLLKDGYQLDIAAVATSDTVKLHDNAHVIETADGSPAISFDGENDYVALGRLTEFEASQKLAFSIDFVTDGVSGGEERLVWNHSKLGLTLDGDTLIVHAANAEDHFSSGFSADGLDLNDGNRHNATVMIDAETDRLQLVVDDILVLDEESTDFEFVGAGGNEWGWSLGTVWDRWFDGEVHGFQVSDDFSFVEASVAKDDAAFI